MKEKRGLSRTHMNTHRDSERERKASFLLFPTIITCTLPKNELIRCMFSNDFIHHMIKDTNIIHDLILFFS